MLLVSPILLLYTAGVAETPLDQGVLVSLECPTALIYIHTEKGLMTDI